MQTKTPITLIAGSLGSGKTTLLQRISDTIHRPIAIFINEFGELSVDCEVFRKKNIEVIPLPGGCVCCSLLGDFEAAVRSVLERTRPHAIVVETTGAAELEALADEVRQNLVETRLDSIIYVADAYSGVRQPALIHSARSQLSAADILLLNKIDLVTMDEIREVEALLRHYNPHAVLFRTMGCDVDTRLLFGLDVQRLKREMNHHGEPLFQSFLFACDAPLDKARFLEVLSDLPREVYRGKGFVVFQEGSCLFNYVVGRADLEDFPAERTQIVFMGRDLDPCREEIVHRLRSCECRGG